MDTSACPRCGASIPAGNNFCENCGAQLSKKQEPKATPASPVPETAPGASTLPEAPRKKIPTSLFILAGVIVVVVIASALFLMPKTTDDPIIGNWEDDDGSQWVVYPNGTLIWWDPNDVLELVLEGKATVHHLTWTKTGTGKYLMSDSSGASAIFVYDATRDVFYLEDFPDDVRHRSATVLTPPTAFRTTPTPVPTTKTTDDPIIGNWEEEDTQWVVYPNNTLTWWYRDSSLAYTDLIARGKATVHHLTWTKTGTGRYLMLNSTGGEATYVYNATSDTIYREDNPAYIVHRSATVLTPPTAVQISPTPRR